MGLLEIGTVLVPTAASIFVEVIHHIGSLDDRQVRTVTPDTNKLPESSSEPTKACPRHLFDRLVTVVTPILTAALCSTLKSIARTATGAVFTYCGWDQKAADKNQNDVNKDNEQETSMCNAIHQSTQAPAAWNWVDRGTQTLAYTDKSTQIPVGSSSATSHSVNDSYHNSRSDQNPPCIGWYHVFYVPTTRFYISSYNGWNCYPVALTSRQVRVVPPVMPMLQLPIYAVPYAYIMV